MSIIEVKNLYRTYQEGRDVLKGINRAVSEGEFLGIMGRSGCGKTTLLKVLGLIDSPNKGELYFGERNTEKMSYDELAKMRRRNIGFVFQDYYLMNTISVEENILLPRLLDDRKKSEAQEELQKYARLMKIEHLLQSMPDRLSGGEKQRVAISRALINQPDLILADEPTGNLDSKAGQVVIDTLKYINEKLGKTIIMVTHDPIMASYCSRIVFLKDGNILEELSDMGGQEEAYEKILKKMKEL